GDDALNLPLLAQGGSGVVSVVGHVVGDAWLEVIAGLESGNLAHAQEATARIWPVVVAVMGGGQGACMIKAALELMGVLERRTVRLPLFAANEQEVGHVRQALIAAGLRPTN
ncbi:MAG: dihydrodipicolinate synthase family protein, partial [Micrococcales bacterium]|nr:dihydrodipicolinate synthase family protein [Micrococcales bacterium]